MDLHTIILTINTIKCNKNNIQIEIQVDVNYSDEAQTKIIFSVYEGNNKQFHMFYLLYDDYVIWQFTKLPNGWAVV